jgi:hypothetical protein
MKFVLHGASLLACLAPMHLPAVPTIEITNVPPFGSTQDLGGLVLDASPAAYRVAVFIYVPGAGWWTKPTSAQPLTVLQPDGHWTADITTADSDTNATKTAALLVGASYNPPCVEGLASLPASIMAQAVASVVVERDDPRVRRLDFSGYNWWVKTSADRVGPGPNYFSDSTNNVRLDAEGRLHLRITHRSNQWPCAEIVSRRTFGYGHYRFALEARVDNLDTNVVLGLFTWSDDPAYAHREIDIECARWGNAADPNNAQFVVQPWDSPGHLTRFAVPPPATNSTHLFIWETNRVRFQSLRGGFSPSPEPANVLSAWTYALEVPNSGDENVRLNLWLNNGIAPGDSNEVEVIIRSFEFVPLGLPRPAQFDEIHLPAPGQVDLRFRAEPDRRYVLEVCEDLVTWRTQARLLATNSVLRFADTHPPAGTGYYRVLTLP